MEAQQKENMLTCCDRSTLAAAAASWSAPIWQPIEAPVIRPLWEVFRNPGRAEFPTTQLNSSSFLSLAPAAPSGDERSRRLYHSIARLFTAASITWAARVRQWSGSAGIGMESRPARLIGKCCPVEVWRPLRQCLRNRTLKHKDRVRRVVPSRVGQSVFSSNQTSFASSNAPIVDARTAKRVMIRIQLMTPSRS